MTPGRASDSVLNQRNNPLGKRPLYLQLRSAHPDISLDRAFAAQTLSFFI